MPDVFFTLLLPEIRSPIELKTTLHLMWLLSLRAGKPRCIEYRELAGDPVLLPSLKIEDSPRPAEDYLREGLELAVTRGTVLHLRLRRGARHQSWYFLNTADNREAVASLQPGPSGDMAPVLGAEALDDVSLTRPNVFALYEQNVGPLTPLVAERLRDACREYPPPWIEEAIRMSVDYNKRSWRYIEAILQRWQAEGKDEGLEHRGADQDDPYGFFKSKYRHLYR